MKKTAALLLVLALFGCSHQKRHEPREFEVGEIVCIGLDHRAGQVVKIYEDWGGYYEGRVLVFPQYYRVRFVPANGTNIGIAVGGSGIISGGNATVNNGLYPTQDFRSFELLHL